MSDFKFGPGAPPKYRSAKSLQKKIAEYFNSGVKVKKVLIGRGDKKEVVEIAEPTITGLVNYCGFASRQSFYDYEKEPKFSYTIKRARLFMEQEYEELLKQGMTTAIFALKNFGWVDKTEVENTDGKSLQNASTEELEERLKELDD